ncbi:DUF1351 domain-containing protein [Pseudoalteromonas agarivorans]|uniref:DUF1351 domain-containing protein n=1 Tax=Pseudoalteromonas agarivorans TaxID=176102 RepID=UPI002119AA55|nr:DUF1351 domain-containing protein [Pseudoalteromonas agarivorans]MCQ8884505.1 DUF1351 domain-containing protein [Pseudoalteromonas agarivorans]
MTTNQNTATNLVEVVYQEDLTKKGLADLRKQYPKSFSLDMSDEDEFKQGRKIRTERNKLVKSINDRRIGFTNELKAYGDELISKIDVIYDPIINAFELEDKRRKEEAARIAKEREAFLNKQRQEIAQMHDFTEQCKNQSSQFIADTIEAVDLVDTESFDKELIHEAIDTKKNILEALNNMYQAAKAAEAVEAEREQLRIQQEAIAQQERLQKQAQEIGERINNLRNDPMNYFDKSSAAVAERIEKLEQFTPTADKFGDRLDEVIQVLAQVIQQLKMMHQQKLQLESVAVTTDPEPQVQVSQEPVEQGPTLEQQERDALAEANKPVKDEVEPLLGNNFKSPVFESTSAPTGYTPLDLWPSSQDRADNEELDRICDQLDVAESYIEVLEQRLNKALAA